MGNLAISNDLIVSAFTQYSNMLLRIAFQNTKNQSDAEDVVQDVFVKMMKEKAFNDDTHVKAWLIRVTINHCKNYRKAAWIRKTTLLTDERWLPLSQEQSEVFEQLWMLPQKYRNVIYLYFYEGYAIPEIARILNANENTVSSRFSRGKRKLKALLMEGEHRNEK